MSLSVWVSVPAPPLPVLIPVCVCLHFYLAPKPTTNPQSGDCVGGYATWLGFGQDYFNFQLGTLPALCVCGGLCESLRSP